MNPELRLIQGEASTASANRPPIMLVQPNGRIRLGLKKYLRLKRGQDIIEMLGWASVIAVTTMFLVDGGIKSVVDIPTALSSISRLTALLATNLLLIHILLVARIPWIDHFYGHDKATAAHKKLGKPILYLVLAHFIASLTQYAIVDGKNVVDELFFMIGNVQDMLTATAALLLMIAVVVTSLNFARKKMSYEAWYIVHVLSYLAVLAAVPHQFSTGSDIVGKPIQTAYWVTLYLFVVFNLVWYRLLYPIIRGYKHNLKIATVVSESSDTTSLYLTGNKVDKLGAKSGQFYLLRVMTKSQWWRPHPFSISAAPNSKFVRFTIGNRGDDTAALQNIKPGTRVMLEGPYGVFTEDRRTREKVVLIAAGIGIPPVRALAESMAARPGDLTVIYRTRDESDASLIDEVREIAKRRGHNLHVLAGRRGTGDSWMNADAANTPDQARLTLMAPWISEADVYVCGPAAWTRSVVKSLKKSGTPESQIHAEEFAW